MILAVATLASDAAARDRRARFLARDGAQDVLLRALERCSVSRAYPAADAYVDALKAACCLVAPRDHAASPAAPSVLDAAAAALMLDGPAWFGALARGLVAVYETPPELLVEYFDVPELARDRAGNARRSRPRLKPLGHIEVDVADFWTTRVLSAGSRSSRSTRVATVH